MQTISSRNKVKGFSTPMCKVDAMFALAISQPMSDEATAKREEHRRNCPECKARLRELNNIARNARHPELEPPTPEEQRWLDSMRPTQPAQPRPAAPKTAQRPVKETW